ncbi:MAG: hypothetical protein SVU24_02855 [Pseudomonadota bacterium]|jgi:hypothetical protein|nr:hypothetical protein [Pseudomonadota bacterium]
MVKKILLALVLLPLLCGLFLWQVNPGWWQALKSEWLAGFNAEHAQAAARWRNDGLAFGRQSDQQGCLERTLSRFDGCTGFDCTVNYGRFLRACLESARPSAGFCDAVPPFREEPSEDDKSWARHTCWGRNIRGEGCRLLLREQQLFCGIAEEEPKGTQPKSGG